MSQYAFYFDQSRCYACHACSVACKDWNGIELGPEKWMMVAVLVIDEKCDGCRKCLEACPYGSPKFASDAPGTKMTKCTMCYDRLENGDKPLCVESCPLRAFDFGTLEEMESKYGTNRQLEGMPEPTTKPNFIVSENG